jgi:hypothetical protein
LTIGAAILELGDLVGPKFLLVSRAVTLEYIRQKVETLHRSKESYITGDSTEQYAVPTEIVQDIAQLENSDFFLQPFVSSSEVWVMRIFFQLLGKGKQHASDDIFWRQCKKFLTQRKLHESLKIEFSSRNLEKVRSLIGIDW